jgi:hypothetical protein
VPFGPLARDGRVRQCLLFVHARTHASGCPLLRSARWWSQNFNPCPPKRATARLQVFCTSEEHAYSIRLVPLCLSYSNKATTVNACQQIAKLFDGLPRAPQVIPAAPAPTRRKRYWTAEEDEFIRQQYTAGMTITEIARQLASNRWAIKKRVKQLELPMPHQK